MLRILIVIASDISIIVTIVEQSCIYPLLTRQTIIVAIFATVIATIITTPKMPSFLIRRFLLFIRNNASCLLSFPRRVCRFSRKTATSFPFTWMRYLCIGIFLFWITPMAFLVTRGMFFLGIFIEVVVVAFYLKK
jgi:hypothetical protein